MRGFADKHNPIAGKAVGSLHRKRKYATSGFDGHGSEQRMRAALDFGGQRRVVHGRKFGAMRRRNHADQARPAAGKRNQREWTLLGVEFSRRIVVRPRMRKIERERGLRISVPPRHDPGSCPTHRARTIRADRKLHPRFAVGMSDGDGRGLAFDHQRRRRNRF